MTRSLRHAASLTQFGVLAFAIAVAGSPAPAGAQVPASPAPADSAAPTASSAPAVTSPGAAAVPPAAEAAPAPATETPSAASQSSDSNHLKLHITNTAKFSAGLRLLPVDAKLGTAPYTINANDGDNAFAAGNFTTSRVDLLSELDLSGKYYGFRFSGEGWYDFVYNTGNAIKNPATVNWLSAPYNNFTKATRRVNGYDGQLLDAFAYLNGHLGSVKTTARFGQFAQVWGESLFLGANSITGGMNPVDIIKALSVPDAQFKEIVLPVPQISAQFQFTSNLSLSAYYQLAFQRSRLPGVGSYFATNDLYDVGGERLFAGFVPTPAGNIPGWLFRGNDVNPPNHGQYGVQLRVRPPNTGLDLGLYALAFNERVGTPYVAPGFNVNVFPGATINGSSERAAKIGEYEFVYPSNVRVYGVSASTGIGDYSIGGEFSYRVNQDLNSTPWPVTFPGIAGVPIPPGTPLSCAGAPVRVAVANNTTNPCYAIGTTLHADANVLWTLPRNFISKEGSLLVELGWLHLNGVTQNPAALNPNTTRNDAEAVLQYTPTFRGVRPGLDLNVPITYQVGLAGKSPLLGAINSGGVGSLNVAFAGTYKQTVVYRFAYTHYTGPKGPTFDYVNEVSGQNTLADRDTVTFSVTRTF